MSIARTVCICSLQTLVNTKVRKFLFVYSSSKSDSPKQQSKKLKKLLKQDKPKSKAKAEHKSGGFKLKKSAKTNKKSKPKGTIKM